MNLLRIFLLASAIFSSLLIFSCRHEPELLPGTAEVCFDQEVIPVIQSNCAVSGCHDGSGELNSLTTYDAVRNLANPGKPNSSKLHEVLSANLNAEKHMPPKSRQALTTEQINNIYLWILQGANHTTCPDVPCDTLNVTFAGAIQPLIDTYCKGCHIGSNPNGGISLVDYASIKTSAESGRLMGAVNQLSGFKAMPPNGGKLPSCNIVQLNKWIINGMPNN